ncbi:MAG: MerR family transcriptional regulator [Deltaproteobacteria bacterium]|nr:MerR family transcriptional regulator [Deltaproteobacteria bacterium]NIS76949.1 MerR family transcriptional regulator [Deltaproteobacteria bacterium]
MAEKTGKKYQIGEVSKILNLSIRTIRYYEEIGLLNSIKRVEHGKRVYSEEEIRRLKFIKKLKLLGLSLAEMQELEQIYRIHKTNVKVLPKLIKLLEENATKVDERINQLSTLKKEILEYKKRMKEKLEEELGNTERSRRKR